MLITRRGLLGGFAAFLAAPAIVRAASLMPVSAPEPFWTPRDQIITLKDFRSGAQHQRRVSLDGDVFDAMRRLTYEHIPLGSSAFLVRPSMMHAIYARIERENMLRYASSQPQFFGSLLMYGIPVEIALHA